MLDSDASSDDDDIFNIQLPTNKTSMQNSKSQQNLLDLVQSKDDADDKSIRSESERGQQDHEMDKH